MTDPADLEARAVRVTVPVEQLQTIGRIEKLIEWAKQTDSRAIVREGQDKSFPQLLEPVGRALQAMRKFEQLVPHLQALPFRTIDAVYSALDGVMHRVQAVRERAEKIEMQDWPRSKDSELSSLQGNLEQHMARLDPWIPLAAAATIVAGEAGRREGDRVLAVLQVTERDILKLKSDAEQAVKETLATLQAAQVKGHAKHFGEEADRHREAGRNWLLATIILAATALGFAWYNLYRFTPTHAPESTAQALQYGLGKVFLFALLVTGTIWAGRVYRAHRHNMTVNRHRANALSSFEAFTATTQTDEATRNAVLLHVASAIYAPQATGFAEHELDAAIVKMYQSLLPGGAKPPA